MLHEAANPDRLDSRPDSAQRRRPRDAAPFPADLVLTAVSRNPIQLERATRDAVLNRPVPSFAVPHDPSVPQATIVVVTFNNLVFTRMCLESLLANTEHPNYEVLVVDNASTDGTPDYLRRLAARHSQIRLLWNETNLGFAAANNRALAQAKGDVLVLLNNDTIVPRGLLSSLMGHLGDAEIGLVVATTNRIGNEAEIETSYRTYGEFEQFAAQYTHPRRGACFDIRTACMFCLAMRRDAFEQIGPLDERFEVGMFEDDDYAMRVRAAGYRVICAEDGFIHHFGQASFGRLIPTGEYGRLMAANKRLFEEKWGGAWQPHARRPAPIYEQLKQSIRQAVCEATPPGVTLLVVSKGDDDLLAALSADGRRAWHFPQAADGSHAGFYPADSETAIAHLEELRAKGGQYLLFPAPSLWWPRHYAQFGSWLDRRYQSVFNNDRCVIHRLSQDSGSAQGRTEATWLAAPED